MKNLFIFLVLALFTIVGETAETKIGYYDMQKAIQATDAGKKAKKELEDEFNKKKAELQSKEKNLKKMKDDLEKKSMVMSDEVKQKKAMEFQEEYAKFQETMMRSQQEIKAKEVKLTEPIVEKIRDIIAGIGEKENYTIILEKAENGVSWAPKALDLTEKVVAKFNNK
ncbi:MAG: OmpH family outer membrane protein [Oligoflexia bacterium]|nr:OmpH family outer membrane protein [Oligoflexia bacterium]